MKKRKSLDSIKNDDPKSFPPWQRVFVEQTKRTCFVAKLYKTAAMVYQSENYTEIDFAWQLADGNEFLEINDTHREKLCFTQFSTRIAVWVLLTFFICLYK